MLRITHTIAALNDDDHELIAGSDDHDADVPDLIAGSSDDEDVVLQIYKGCTFDEDEFTEGFDPPGDIDTNLFDYSFDYALVTDYFRSWRDVASSLNTNRNIVFL